jgi:trk system potassium uptake protein TrkH
MFRRFVKQFFTPTRVTVTSFAILVVAGSALLATPLSTTDGTWLAPVDALFVATSAVCVTGLSPIDVSSELSFFGHLVVLVLMQLGGLGLMTFTTTLYVWLGERMSITERLTIQENLLPSASSQIKRILAHVIGYTVLVEGIGAAFLAGYWITTGKFDSVAKTLWFAVFHSVSAFTNGSFALFPNSLIDFQRDHFVLIVISSLIAFGGLGFLVVFELSEYVARRISGQKFRIGVQSRLTLITTAALIVVGTAAFYVLERNGAFAALTSAEALTNAYFFAIVPRTAGFNTVRMSEFGGAAGYLLMILMFVGASPGSTGGGIKTTTFGLLVAYSYARFRGRSQLDLWNRTIPQTSIDKATAVVVASAATVLLATLTLMFTETRGMNAFESQARLMPVLFETISAFGTVGLSLDFTPVVSTAGKLVLVFLMFVGRVGAITLALAISLNARPAKFSYAEENIMIG